MDQFDPETRAKIIIAAFGALAALFTALPYLVSLLW